MAWEHDDDKCPLAAVDRRLSDLHRFWHQAERAYFDPEEFRVAIQAAIQTARQVTFVLQNNKRLIPGFDAWYAEWQKLFGSMPLMRWMVDARNRIEKQGDLEAHSFVSAEIVASHLDEGPKIQVPSKLFDAPLALVKGIPDSLLGEHIRTDGILRIRRRWIENTLPDTELLDAVATAYGQLAQMVYSAHEQAGLVGPVITDVGTGCQYPKADQDGRLPCMIGHEDKRTLDIWLATGQPLEFETIKPEMDLSEVPVHSKRYGIKPGKMYAESGRAHDHLRLLFTHARKVFKKDGYHIMLLILLRDGKPVEFHELRPMEHGHKFMMMRDMAHQARKIGADAVILISEVWSAPADPSRPYQRAVGFPVRKEYLTATAVSKNDEPLMLCAEIRRKGPKVTLGPTSEELDCAHFAFAPFYEIWKKEIPAAWAAIPMGVDGTKDEKE